MNIIEYADRDMLAIDLANVLAGELETALLHDELVSLVVPGGTTPGPVFDDLCAADLDWARVRVMASDERWVPQDSERSNARLISERLLTARAASATLVPFHVPGAEPEEVLPELEAVIAPDLPISVLLLGMGADMHTASLFPGAPGLDLALRRRAPVLVPVRPENQPEARVSFSARVLNDAVAKHLVIFGEDKREALANSMGLPPEEAPIQAVISDMTIHWAA